jgi:hypothetical protein
MRDTAFTASSPRSLPRCHSQLSHPVSFFFRKKLMTSNSLRFAASFMMLSLAAGCGDDGESTTLSAGGGGSSPVGGGGSSGSGGSTTTPEAPLIASTIPLDGANGVAINESVSALFTEAMSPATLTENTFKLTFGAEATPVSGTVVYGSETAVFWPAAHLANNATYSATITTGAESASGVALAASHTWTFSTGDTIAPLIPVDLGTAGGYAVLSKSGISTVPTSAITGNVAISPAAASFITGFSLSADASSMFSTSPQITGRVYAADYAPPTPSNLTTAIGDMEIAFASAAARAPDVIELGAGDIGGMTLLPGVYKWGTGLLIPTSVTLTGSATDVWIFQVAQNLTVSDATNIVLTGGALAKNVFWQVAGLTNVGTTAHFEGIVLCQTSITLNTGASINGRLLAQTAVNLDSSTIVEPAK